MSSQRTDFPPVSFSAKYPQKSLRLLELPHELVAMIEEGRKTGAATRMQLKSASTSQGYLHLCTKEKMWAVKQVSTSNSVYVTESTSTGTAGEQRSKRRKIEQDEDEAEQMDVDHEQRRRQKDETGEMTAVAQVKNILELVDVDTDAGQVESMVRNMLPPYQDADADDDDEEIGRNTDSDTNVRVEDMLHGIPAPDKAILDAARRLFVFALAKGGDDEPALYMPTSSLLLRAWKSLMQAYTLSAHKAEWDDVGTWLGPVLDDMRRDSDDENDSALLTAVAMACVRRLAVLQVDADSQPAETFITMPEIVGWDGSGGCAVVGQWLLKSLQRGNRPKAAQAVSVEAFKQEWEQMLPDSWAKECNVVSLIKSTPGVEIVTDDQGEEVFKFPTTTALDGSGRIAGTNKIAVGPALAPPTTAVADVRAQKKRKWHEKFGAQRNAVTKK
ncbi:hypothetical protein PV08_09046 [Exophiala spinifera]|uniref:Sister chromatid cohesion protein Dcc1 n=1 Tax=Exophiala spinifera TaxID=91928 RepID=A0A0D2BKG8_9EURO|nr:uncharacterized protein PV08_09046 [Exophiala spinifera]KIW11774.1 hypothetical protein PV08_09046 [Exophiala spinifera]